MSATLLIAALREPASVCGFSNADWADLLCVARAERLMPSLAHRLGGIDMPPDVTVILDAAKHDAEVGRVQALWEAEMARRALAPLGVAVVLLKGTAYVAAGLSAGQGRLIGDLDILVPRDALPEVERALQGHGWEWVKPDAYDDAYYRRWMHELPPLIHRERDQMIDVHHTILPLTARPRPDAAALLKASIELPNGLSILSPNDMLVHASAHLFADGDLTGGLRNLWDIHCLLDEFGDDGLTERARQHGLALETARAVRLSRMFSSPIELARADRMCLVGCAGRRQRNAAAGLGQGH